MYRGASVSLLASFLFALTFVNAADVPEPKTVMTERAKLLFSDDLTRQPGQEWKIGKGKWEISDGVLKGTELKEEKHGAVMRHAVKFENAVVQFSFKLDSVRSISLTINDATGHVGRVAITPRGFSVRKDKHDKKSPDQAALLDEKKIALKPGEWHTMVVEMQGKEMSATLDGKMTAFGAHDSFTVEKANVGLAVGGDSVSFKNLRVWQATPNKDWAATKTQLLEARTKSASK